MRYFTGQSAHDNATDAFVIVGNRFYLDATLKAYSRFWEPNFDSEIS